MSSFTDALKSGDVTYGELKQTGESTEFSATISIRVTGRGEGEVSPREVSRIISQALQRHPRIVDHDVDKVRPTR